MQSKHFFFFNWHHFYQLLLTEISLIHIPVPELHQLWGSLSFQYIAIIRSKAVLYLLKIQSL